jgi:hypothetical protein
MFYDERSSREEGEEELASVPVQSVVRAFKLNTVRDQILASWERRSKFREPPN